MKTHPFDDLNISLPTRPQDKRIYANLSGSAFGFTLAAIVKEYPGIVLAVVEDSQTAAKLERELAFFLKADHSETVPILSFPDWETLPYDTFSPHQDIISERLTTLYRLPNFLRGVLIVPVATLMHCVCPKEYLWQNALLVNKGDKIELDKFRHTLVECGYRATPQVLEHGDFAIRGSLLDLYPMGSRKPYRIDLFDTEVDSIRTFDVETQRSLEKVERLQLLPAREFPLNAQGISDFRTQFRDQFEGDPRQCTVYMDVSEGNASPGLEYYLPLFFNKTANLFDYLPKDCLVASIGDIESSANTFWDQVTLRYEQYRHDRLRPILEPKRLFLQTNEIFSNIKQFPHCQLIGKMPKDRSGEASEHSVEINEHLDSTKSNAVEKARSPVTQESFSLLPDLALNSAIHLNLKQKREHLSSPLSALQQFLNEWPGRVLLVAETNGRREILKELLIHVSQKFIDTEDFSEFYNNKHQYGLSVAPIEEGMLWHPNSKTLTSLALIPEAALFGKRVMQRRLRKVKSPDFDFELRSLAELNIAAPVVHLEYGVGRYMGLTVLKLAGHEAEFLTLEYAGGDKLYVPVTSLHLVSRYSGVDLEHAPLSRLGSGQWDKVKRKVLEKTHDVAAELLELYAKREAKKGFAFEKPDEHYQAFAAEFPFEETPDQTRVIQDLMNDLIAAKPMDRVVCGDVGFGKTEVALRAAFLVAHQGKQVAILVPTTLLAEQHFQTFSDRFANFPIQIEVLSRFKTKKEQEQILLTLKEGKTDIIIGTHKLLQDNVAFKNLGLLIIDEEHRFGVRQKEIFKKFRSEVDILTLTATPIPRTLNMAMSGMRDLSIIATPPARRLSIKTFVRERSGALIQEAIFREIHRGGQVYYLHNDVDTIENAAHELQNLVPTSRIAVAHGQMRERELEQIMSDFYHRRYNVLVCTTIIETGIDIPTANTIIIDRADKFGLAQLHQLRGRVGRSHHQAYAFCLIPAQSKISSDAKKRLEAIESLGELGVGFTLATHDLEIRGAGELLGEEQSGNIQSVGFPLFMELLDNAVKLLREGLELTEEISSRKQTEIDLHIPTLIPESYLPDVHTRLLIYKRLANCKNKDELNDLRAEIIDRFGMIPPQTRNLFKVTELKINASRLGIVKIDAGPKGGRIEFGTKTNIEPANIIQLIQEKPQFFKLEGPQKLRIKEEIEDPELRIQAVLRWVAALGFHEN